MTSERTRQDMLYTLYELAQELEKVVPSVNDLSLLHGAVRDLQKLIKKYG